ncbi:hypothetical protein SAMN04487939_10897 [Lysobacter sp. yr284]|uniref:hypothetical protein n=1 Tax=Lysobacter TaxID=68 RepID=UPI00089710D7|nr:hypothetical protein [Lysobacter sp. yr284]SDY90711.1 hypothetical protein SAMN04487939_10897 [Lysobacter sp. yr284]
MNACSSFAIRVRGLAPGALAGVLLAAALTACGERAAAPAPAAATAPPAASAPAAPAFDFAAWVASNAACAGGFISDVQEAGFDKTLRDAGVGISDDASVGEVGVGSGTLTPGTPIRLHGFPVRRIDFDFGSGATFAVVVEATPEQARAAIGAKPLPQVYRDVYSEGVPMAEATEDVPMPDIRFVRAGDEPGTQEIGCAAFDG